MTFLEWVGWVALAWLAYRIGDGIYEMRQTWAQGRKRIDEAVANQPSKPYLTGPERDARQIEVLEADTDELVIAKLVASVGCTMPKE